MTYIQLQRHKSELGQDWEMIQDQKQEWEEVKNQYEIEEEINMDIRQSIEQMN